MFEDRFGNEDVGGFGDGVEFGYMTDDDLGALAAVEEFERSDPDDKDFVASTPVESRVAKKRAAEDTWWRSSASRRKLMDDVSARFRGPDADIDLIQAMFDDMGIILDPYKDGLRGQCPDDDHFSNSKKPFHVSASGWCYCFACAQSKGADYRGQDAVSYYKEHMAGKLSPKEAYARLADIAHIDVRSYSADKLAEGRVREASRFADPEGKYTWGDIRKINEVRSAPLEQRQDYMRRQATIGIRREAQRFFQGCLHAPDRTLVEPVRRRLERARKDSERTYDEKREIYRAMDEVRGNIAALKNRLRDDIANLDAAYSSGSITRERLDERYEDLSRACSGNVERLEVSLESAEARLRELSGAIEYHDGVIASAERALSEAENAAARAKEMAEYLVGCGIATRSANGYDIPAHIGYAPPVKSASVRYLLSGSTSDGTRFSPSDVRCAGIGQMSTKRQIEAMKTEDVLYDRLTFPIHSTKSGELVGFSGIRPDEPEAKYMYMCTKAACRPDGSADDDPSVAFDWKSDVYNALNAAPSAQALGTLYVANNPLEVERLRAAGIDNVVSPPRGGEERGEGLRHQFHYRSHDETIGQIAEAISDLEEVQVRQLTQEMADGICLPADDHATQTSPVRDDIDSAISQVASTPKARSTHQRALGQNR